MIQQRFFCGGQTPAIQFAKTCLMQSGIRFSDSAGWDTENLLLDVPSFRPGDQQRVETLLSSLPKHITVWGGNLQHHSLKGFSCRDLLEDELYLTKNAAITADCTMHILKPLLKQPLSNTKALIIGWGRIGKYLAPLLMKSGCHVTVSARKEADCKYICDSDFDAVETSRIQTILPTVDLIINTVPAMILPESPANILKIDLASVKGIAGEDVLWARGLPGRYAPEQSGKLICDTILRILKEDQA